MNEHHTEKQEEALQQARAFAWWGCGCFVFGLLGLLLQRLLLQPLDKLGGLAPVVSSALAQLIFRHMMVTTALIVLWLVASICFFLRADGLRIKAGLEPLFTPRKP